MNYVSFILRTNYYATSSRESTTVLIMIIIILITITICTER